MKKKNVLKRAILGFMALVMILTSVTPVFAAEDDTSRFEKTEYEDLYGKNGSIDMVEVSGFDTSYKLTNGIYLGSNVVMYLITQNLFEIDDSILSYVFEGTMNANNKYCDIGFSYDIGLVENKKISNSPTLECGETVNIREYQFSIYPGFYNFYRGGMNDFLSSNGKTIIIKTLTPDFNLSQNDKYLKGKDAWVEVKQNDTVRVYVMIGTKNWYDEVTDDVVDWAMEIEKSIYNSEIKNLGTNEEVEVDVDEDKLKEVLKDKEVLVEEETDSEESSSKPIFIESTPKEPETPAKDYGPLIKYGIIILIFIIIGVVGVNVYKKITTRKY